jgi:malate dehydrogenase
MQETTNIAQQKPAYNLRVIPKVTVVGSGNVGATLAQRLLDKKLADITLLDIVPGRPQGLALDLRESQPLEGYPYSIVGTNDYADTVGSDVIVITAGLPRKPGMSRDDLLQVNGKIVIEVIQRSMALSPNAHLIVVTNPLDVMTYLAWQVSGLPAERVMGMAGVLDAARFRTFIGEALGVPPQDVSTLVLGGHGDLMVPLLSYTTVNGIPVRELLSESVLARLVQRTRDGGAEVVDLLKTGGAFYAPASATASMVEAILRNQSRLLTASAYLTGHYRLFDVFLGVPCRIGRTGIESVVELTLSAQEQEALASSAQSVRSHLEVALGLLAELSGRTALRVS